MDDAAPTPAAPTPPKRRWLPRPRFSLRTLIIFVLLIGSAGGLWWRWEAWGPALVLRGHSKAITACGLSRDGSKIITCSQEKTAKVWSVGTGATLATLDIEDAAVRFAALSPDGTRVATASENRTITEWDLQTGRKLGSASASGGQICYASPEAPLFFSADGSLLIAEEGCLQIWDASSFEKRYACYFERRWDWGTPYEKLLAFQAEETAGKMRAKNAQSLKDVIPYEYLGIRAAVERSGNRVATIVEGSPKIKLWDTKSFEKVGELTLSGHSELLYFWLSPGARFVVLVFRDDAQVLSTQTGKTVLRITRPYESFLIPFSDDSRLIMTAGEAGVTLWSTETGEPLNKPRRCGRPTLSHDGCRSLEVWDLGEDSSMLALYDSHTGAQLAEFWPPCNEHLRFAHLSPDNRSVTAVEGEKLCIWHRRHPEPWWGLAWLPEFWLAVVFSCALLWTIRSDRRSLR